MCYGAVALRGATGSALMMQTVINTPCESSQAERLRRLLPHWLGHVPLYRASAGLVASNRGQGGFDLEQFQHLPLITKRDLREGFPGNFLAPGVDLETLLDLDLVEVEHTSGTSEARASLLLGRGWWAEQEARALRLNRVVSRVLDEFPGARRVTLASPVCSGDICYTGVPSRQERTVGDALYVNLSRHPFLWGEADLARMAGEARRWKPQFLDVDPVYGVLFGRYCARQRVRLPSLQFILCSYEYVSLAHRRYLEKVFGVPVFNLYGSTETGHLLMETESGRLAPSFETAFLEVIRTDASGVGELVVTTLSNEYMPLIRYRIGDLVERERTPEGTNYTVHGRVLDAFTNHQGKRVTTRQVDQCFEGLSGFLHYQLHQQQGQDRWRLLFVADDPPPTKATLEELRGRLTAVLEATGSLVLEEKPMLLGESSGKFRLGYPGTGDSSEGQPQFDRVGGPLEVAPAGGGSGRSRAA